jgi:hypothetical protein
MLKEWDHAGDIGDFEFAPPMSVTYQTTMLRKKWETTFDLVCPLIQDIVPRDWELPEKPESLEIRNLRF